MNYTLRTTLKVTARTRLLTCLCILRTLDSFATLQGLTVQREGILRILQHDFLRRGDNL